MNREFLHLPNLAIKNNLVMSASETFPVYSTFCLCDRTRILRH